MLPTGLLPHLDGLTVEDVLVYAGDATFAVAGIDGAAECPRCRHCSNRIHSRYRRTMRDLPIGPNTVTLRVRVRRFICVNRGCPQVTFAERFPTLGRPRSRRTIGQEVALEQLGMALGGSAGSVLAKRMSLPASRSTVLRVVLAASRATPLTPRVLGVDDWARLRGQIYGTILVDLERRCPIDLLPDRSAESFAAWLREHPGVEIISRDRGGAYAEGARQGAPGAVQIADRWHLLKNVGDVVERVLARKHACIKDAASTLNALASKSSPSASVVANLTPESAKSQPSTRSEETKEARRARRLAIYDEVALLHEQGHSSREIARRLGLGRPTVLKFINALSFPERAPRSAQPTILTPYEVHLRQRWMVGVHNARVLWEEIRAQGFTGSASLVRQFLARWRQTPGSRGPTPQRYAAESAAVTPPPPRPIRALSPCQAKWLLLRDVRQLSIDELAYREELLRISKELQVAQFLALGFGRIVRELDRTALPGWMNEAERSGLGEFEQFAIVLRRDLPAVEAALTYKWSNGQTEGQINRLKLLKRQMYGRASITLLRRRFLPVA